MSVNIVRRDEKDLTKYAFTIQQLAEGRSNATGSFTMTTSTTTTTVTAPTCGAGSIVVLQPKTSNAAAALGTTYIGTVAAGSFTVTHASNGQTDKTFGFVCIG